MAEPESACYHVIAARDGAEGLSLARSQRPAAIVSDINMPVMDGYDMCHAIRQSSALRDTPVILLTLLSDAADVIRGLNAGADCYVTKPYNQQYLLVRIAALLAEPPRHDEELVRRQVEIDGVCYQISAGGQQVLNLLVSTYSNAVHQNRELSALKDALAVAAHDLEQVNNGLEQSVAQRTAELQTALTQLDKSLSGARAVTETANDAIVTADHEGAVVGWNPAAERLFGYTRKEILGQTLSQLIPQHYREAHQIGMKRVCAGGKRHLIGKRVELHGLSKSGAEFPLELSLSEWETSEGKFFTGIIHDISVRRLADQALRASEVRYRSLFENMLNGYAHCRMIYDAVGQPVDFIYLDVNQSFERLTGLKDVLGKPVSEVIPGIRELSPELFETYGRVASSGNPETFEFDFKSQNKWLTISVYCPVQGTFVAVFDDITEKKHAEQQIKRYLTQLRSAFMGTVEVATTLSTLRDPYTAGHERRVGKIAAAIGAELGLDEQAQEGLRVAGYLHDIGKITIPAEILSKPGKLSPVEYSLIKEHAQASYQVLKDVEFPWPVAQVALQHHERMDGSGYPQGLKGEAILLEARIMAVADVIEAMASHRPYRAGLGIDKALAEIERGRGSAYDPVAADACLKLFRERGYVIPG